LVDFQTFVYFALVIAGVGALIYFFYKMVKNTFESEKKGVK